jgi:3-oxoacyl-[acyl-carrier protein] reductase
MRVNARPFVLGAGAARRGDADGPDGRPEDAARLIAWLCSPEAGWVTGQLIFSDGGYLLA